MFETAKILHHFGIADIQSGSHASSIGWAPAEGRGNFEAICPADGKVSTRISESTADGYQAIIDCAQGTAKLV